MAQTDKRRRVFLVAGRDTRVREMVEKIVSGLGLEVVDWETAIHWTGSPAPHAREVLEAGLNAVGAVIVLLTGDDEAMLRSDLCSEHDREIEGVLRPQARPNVLFEAGIALSLYPRSTVFVQIGRLRPFSDTAGIQFVPLDGSAASLRSLANRLALAGCPVRKSDVSAAGMFPPADAGLPPVPLHPRGSLAFLRALRSYLPFARMGGETEVVYDATVGETLTLSLRIPDGATSLRCHHWPPGAVVPRLIHVEATAPQLVEVPFTVVGPAGIHVLDLWAAGADGQPLAARGQLTVAEA